VAILLTEWIGFGRPQRWRTVAAIGGVLTLVILAVPIAWKTAVWQLPPNDMSLPARVVDAVFDPRRAPLRGPHPGALEYLLTQGTVLPRYLALAVLPWDLNVDPDVPIARALSLPVVAGFGFLIGLAALGLSQVRRRPLVAFGILWFFVTSSVESSLLPIDDVMAEHRMYLPMAGLAVTVGWAFAAALARARRAALSAGAAVVVACIALTFARNVVWLSPLTLWLDAVEKSPDKVRPHTNLGAAYHKADRLDEAVDQYCRALKLDPDDPIAHDNLDLALTTLGTFDHIVPKVVERRPDGSVVLEVEDAATFCPRDGPS
jgi:hypothetical protein